jgi:hypothetical protein
MAAGVQALHSAKCVLSGVCLQLFPSPLAADHLTLPPFACGCLAPQVAKICNNLVMGVTMAGLAEALALGAAAGLDPAALSALINAASGRCWSSEVYNPVPVRHASLVRTLAASRCLLCTTMRNQQPSCALTAGCPSLLRHVWESCPTTWLPGITRPHPHCLASPAPRMCALPPRGCALVPPPAVGMRPVSAPP